MRRPFAWIGFTLMLALLLFTGLDWLLTVLVTVALTLVSVGLLLMRSEFREHPTARKTAALIAATAALGCSLSFFSEQFLLVPADELAGQTVEICGVITEPAKSGGYSSAVIMADSIGGTDSHACELFRVYGPGLSDFAEGDFILCSARMERLDESYTGSSRRSALADGIRGCGECLGDPEPLTGRPKNLRVWIRSLFSSLRAELGENIRADEFSDEREIAVALTTGDTSGIGRGTLDDFRVSGVRHLLSLSGYHLSLLVSIFLGAGLFLGIPHRSCLLLTAVIMLGYMALVGFPYSILRAGIMSFLTLTASFIRRTSDPLNALGVAVLIICLFSPAAAFDVGFQLSVCTTLGIILLAKPLSARLLRGLPSGKEVSSKWVCRLLRLHKTIVRALCVSVSASAASLPVTVLTYGEFSIISPVTTLVSTPLIPFIMIPSFLSGILRPVGWLGWLCSVTDSISGCACTVFRAVAGTAASLPFASLYLRKPYLLVWFIGFPVLILLLRRLNISRQNRRLFALASVAVLLGSVLFDLGLRKDVLFISAVTGAEETCGAVLTQGNQSVYIGTLPNTRSVYDVRSCLEGSTLTVLVLFDGEGIGRAADYFPGTEILTVGDGEAGTCLLEVCTLYLLNDRGGRPAVFCDGVERILILSDGFRVSDLPPECCHPGLSVLTGPVEQIELLQPELAILPGKSVYDERLCLLAKGVTVSDRPPAWESAIVRAGSRGGEWFISAEAL